MDTGDKIREVRQEYKEYLIKKHPDFYISRWSLRTSFLACPKMNS